MKLVVIESPYAGDVEANVVYAKRCVLDSLKRGEAPYASHLLFTQPGILDDRDPEQRKLGIDAGLAWMRCSDLSAIYVDRGVSGGMIEGIRARISVDDLFRIKYGNGNRSGGLELRSLRVSLSVPVHTFDSSDETFDRAVEMAKDFAKLVEGRPERAP